MQLIIETADWDYLGGHWVEGGFDGFEITTGITNVQDQDLEESKHSLLRVIDLLGREVKQQTNRPLFYIYDNGLVEKKYILD